MSNSIKVNERNFYSEPLNLKEFEVFFEENYSKILYYSLKKTKNMDYAEEITQETFIKAFINMRRLKNKASSSAWLFAICKNEVARFFYNSRTLNQNNNIYSYLHENQATHENNDVLSQLAYSLELLTSAHREVITLKYFCGFNLNQMSALTGLGLNKIKSRLFEARSRIFKIMSSNINETDLHNFYIKRRKLIMDKLKLMELGANVFTRLSLNTQKEMLRLAHDGEKFNETLLLEIGAINRGKEFVTLCSGTLAFKEMALILSCCDEETIKRIKWELKDNLNEKYETLINELKKCSERGYLVNYIDIMLHTDSVDKTLEWYNNVLGWNACPGYFDESGKCIYGCVTPDEKNSIINGTRQFTGFHIRKGEFSEHKCGILPLVTVEDLEFLLAKIKKSGWKDVSEINNEEWGARTITVKDLNGYVIQFLEWPPEIKNPYKPE